MKLKGVRLYVISLSTCDGILHVATTIGQSLSVIKIVKTKLHNQMCSTILIINWLFNDSITENHVKDDCRICM